MRADTIGLFPQKVTKCRLFFFEKNSAELDPALNEHGGLPEQAQGFQ